MNIIDALGGIVMATPPILAVIGLLALAPRRDRQWRGTPTVPGRCLFCGAQATRVRCPLCMETGRMPVGWPSLPVPATDGWHHARSWQARAAEISSRASSSRQVAGTPCRSSAPAGPRS
jgi:hypothetical protein